MLYCFGSHQTHLVGNSSGKDVWTPSKRSGETHKPLKHRHTAGAEKHIQTSWQILSRLYSRASSWRVLFCALYLERKLLTGLSKRRDCITQIIHLMLHWSFKTQFPHMEKPSPVILFRSPTKTSRWLSRTHKNISRPRAGACCRCVSLRKPLTASPNSVPRPCPGPRLPVWVLLRFLHSGMS